MILFFYALILLTIVGLLGFALYSQAPTIGGQRARGVGVVAGAAGRARGHRPAR